MPRCPGRVGRTQMNGPCWDDTGPCRCISAASASWGEAPKMTVHDDARDVGLLLRCGLDHSLSRAPPVVPAEPAGSAGNEDGPAPDPAVAKVVDGIVGGVQGVAGGVERDFALAGQGDQIGQIGVGADEVTDDGDFA